ncbi:Flagellar basal-body rod protein FlgC [uncultured Alphaproteobacteria bacterium]|uniref:Flagellar basal-body rod protein FlgC n=1 Tax=uncultured Alphaproteobacteria bacterium TaxID=91750 RepID=A0A212JNX6_9PROT|nr:Flagellar basal-body rod protein FlgC [uncultured Alphaproteobacteria bacterium]
MDDLQISTRVSTSGMKAQATRLRVVSENIANADSVGTQPGEAPYRRKTVSFKEEVDKSLGADLVRVKKIGVDRSDFEKRYEPNHPAADADGYVSLPNVNPLVEMMDMREAQRGYEANLNAMQISRQMISKTVDMLK